MKKLALLLIAILAACSATGGAVPPTTQSAPSSLIDTKHSGHGKRIAIRVAVPLHRHHRGRGPDYFSPQAVSLQLLYGWASENSVPQGPASPSTASINFSQCPQSGNYAICTLTPYLTFTPGGVSDPNWFIQLISYSGANATGNVVDTSGGFASCVTSGYYSNPGPSVVCAATLAPLLTNMAISQQHAFIQGIASTSAINWTPTDRYGAVIPQVRYGVSIPGRTGTKCLMNDVSTPVYLAPSNYVPSPAYAITLTGLQASDYINGLPYCYESTNDSLQGTNSIAVMVGGVGWLVAYDGSATSAPSWLINALSPDLCASTCFQTGVYSLITLPASTTSFASTSSSSQTVTITPPASYTGPVSLTFDSCLLQHVNINATSMTTQSVASSQIATSSPATRTSTSGSPVSFSLTPGAANGGCTYHSNVSAVEYGVAVGM